METFRFETSENPIRLFSVQLAGYLYGNTRLAGLQQFLPSNLGEAAL